MAERFKVGTKIEKLMDIHVTGTVIDEAEMGDVKGIRSSDVCVLWMDGTKSIINSIHIKKQSKFHPNKQSKLIPLRYNGKPYELSDLEKVIMTKEMRMANQEVYHGNPNLSRV
jgi:hypothetical protein